MTKPPTPPPALREAVDAFRAGRLEEAGRLSRQALDAAPDAFDALHLAGLVAARRGDYAAAEQLLARAAAADPRSAAAQLNHGNALRALGRHEDALKAFARALALKPGYAHALANQGTLLLELGRGRDAEAAYRKAVAAAPGDALCHAGLGNALKEQGRLNDAATAFARAVELKPDYAEAHNNLGTTLKDLGRPDEAAAACARAAELRPGDPVVQDNLGAACHDQGRADLTVVHCKRALRLKAPAAGASPWTLAVCDALIDLIGLPAIYPDDAAVAAARGNFAAALDRLNALLAEQPATSAAEEGLIAECLFKLNHFLLGYQQQDDKSLLQSYCAIAVELLKPRFGRFLGPAGRRPGGGKIRLGLASELLMNHNGVNWAYPWLSGLPRGDYEFFFYSLNGRADWLTEQFAALGAYRRLSFRADGYAEALAAIRADELDVLVFPDVGMTASSRIASLARLAPIQCAGWGHPVTTGSPAIDYYLSSGAMEPPDAQDHYSETLVRLPGASVYVHDHDQGGAKAERRQARVERGRGIEAPGLPHHVVLAPGRRHERHLLVGRQLDAAAVVERDRRAAADHEDPGRVERGDLHGPHSRSAIRKSSITQRPSRLVQTSGFLKRSTTSSKWARVMPSQAQKRSMSSWGVSSPRWRRISIACSRDIRPARISSERLSNVRVKPNLSHLSQWWIEMK